MLSDSAKREMIRWLGTMSKRQELRDNADAMAMEMDLIEEALFNGGARIDANVDAVFRHLKSNLGLIYWPTSRQVSDAIRDVQREGSEGARRGDRSKLSFDEQNLLDTKVLPTARRWLSIPNLRDHGKRTLEFWGESYLGQEQEAGQ